MHAKWANDILDGYTAVKRELQLLTSTEVTLKSTMLNRRSHRRIYIIFLNIALKSINRKMKITHNPITNRLYILCDIYLFS